MSLNLVNISMTTTCRSASLLLSSPCLIKAFFFFFSLPFSISWLALMVLLSSLSLKYIMWLWHSSSISRFSNLEHAQKPDAFVSIITSDVGVIDISFPSSHMAKTLLQTFIILCFRFCSTLFCGFAYTSQNSATRSHFSSFYFHPVIYGFSTSVICFF